MKKKILDLKNLRAEKVTRMNELVNVASEAKRELNTEETTEYDEADTECERLDSEIEKLEKLEARNLEIAAKREGNKTPKPNEEEKARADFSFTRIMRHLAAGNPADSLDGLEGEMHKEAIKERQSLGIAQKIEGVAVPSMVLSRASSGQNVATAADGGNLVQDDPLVFVESLRNALVLPKLGAHFLTGLQGDLPVVSGGSFTAAWVAEGAENDTSKESYGKRTLSPKNLMCTGAMSKQLIAQSSPSVEALVRMDLIAAIAHGIENGVINGASGGPSGILADASAVQVVNGTNGLALDWAKIVEFETGIAHANAAQGKLGWLMNSKTRGKLKTTVKAAGEGAGFIWDPTNEINGYAAAVSNVLSSTLTKGTSDVCSSAVFGNWNDLLIGMWGGLDIVVDPFSRKKFHELEITVAQMVNAISRNSKSFAVSKDILTA